MSAADPVDLEILRNRLSGIAEEMGEVLVHGAYSPNIKERRDCSTALFDSAGRMIAQAEHIPVHLGAMPEAVAAVRACDPGLDETFLLNDPFTGGTHLPDITLVSPIAHDGETLGYAVSRAHHADVGGMAPGSMPAGAREIHQEGLRIPPTRLVQGGTIDRHVLELILANVRDPRDRRADLRAQLAAHDRAARRVAELRATRGTAGVRQGFDAVIAYSRRRMESALASLPDGHYTATDRLEGDGVDDRPIEIAVTVEITDAAITVDFEGTAAQVRGNLNAPLAVTKSAVYFAIRCATDAEIPLNHGCYAPVSILAPAESVVNPRPPAAVVGGNVETSQRIADVTLLALAEAAPDRIPAQGQGTMNNLTIGARDGSFAYYETIGGGFGARPGKDGMDGVHVGMTNTLNTPIEAIETAYPLRVDRYALRPNSGGAGRFRGGLGLERTVTVQRDATVSLLTERRRRSPQGAHGGDPGARGENRIDDEAVPSKVTRDVEAGTTITVRTPGGGGYGDPRLRTVELRRVDREDEKVTADPTTRGAR